ncbi:MAG: hypothetical protein SWO11_13665 [Thermodesulfobacteriota bacterium]|nr:hypothetical protein [Thermodesulfobacteriota bacterium]
MADLKPILKEVLRIIKPGQIFVFTVAAQTSNEEMTTSDTQQGYSEITILWGVSIFKHSAKYVTNLLQAYKYRLWQSAS